MEPYDPATIEKHAFDIAKKRLGNDEGTTIAVGGRTRIVKLKGTYSEKIMFVDLRGADVKVIWPEIEGKIAGIELRRKNAMRLGYAKLRREQYDKPDEGNAAYADKVPMPINPLR